MEAQVCGQGRSVGLLAAQLQKSRLQASRVVHVRVRSGLRIPWLSCSAQSQEFLRLLVGLSYRGLATKPTVQKLSAKASASAEAWGDRHCLSLFVDRGLG